MSAELWSEAALEPVLPKPIPQVAPLAILPKAPAPKEEAPDIALEKKRQQLLDKRKEEQKKKIAQEAKKLQDKRAKAKADLAQQQALEDKKRQLEAMQQRAKQQAQQREKQRLEQYRNARLAALRNSANNSKAERADNTQSGAAAGASNAGSGLGRSGLFAAYVEKIIRRVQPHIIFSEEIAGNPAAEIELSLAPDGTILSQKLKKSSGSLAWDTAVQQALTRSSPLPRDSDGKVPPRMVIRFRPQD